MKLLKHLWRYWVWLCVALCTTTVVLLLLATIINHFKPAAPLRDAASACLDSGGAWDDGQKQCHFSS